MDLNLLFFLFFFFSLFSVIFLVMSEHYLLGFSQLRVSPNKAFVGGYLQALCDGLKLFKKELIFLSGFLTSIFLVFGLCQFFLAWGFFGFFLFFLGLKFNIFFLIFLLGVATFVFFFLSYYSVSKYSLLGSVRLFSQSISFDLVYFFFLFSFVFFFQSLDLGDFFVFFLGVLNFFFLLFLVLTESNRSPFDFSEGESELVSGFNLELSGLVFIFFFLAEYLFLIFYILLFVFISLGGHWALGLGVFFLVIFFRAFFPRFRYDYLMGVFWFFLFFFVFNNFNVFFFLVWI